MKKKITFIILCIFITGCSAYNEFSTTKKTSTRTMILTSTCATTSQYEILSPLAIKKDNIIIEVTSYTISSSTFEFGIQIIGLYPSQIPEIPPEYSFSPINEVKFFHGDQDTPLELELFSGSGGSRPNDNGTLTINEDQSYKLVSSFPVGQKQYIIAVVTMHEIFGITEPICFDLEIVPEERIQG